MGAALLPFPRVAAIALTLISALLTVQLWAAEPADPPELSASGSAGADNEGPATAYYRWIDSNGTIQYTDFEPVGVSAERIPLDLEADDAPMLSSATEDQPADTFTDQDQQILPIEHIGPCADARRQLAILHSAQPARTDAIKVARDQVLAQCSDPEAFAREEAAFQEQIQSN